MLRILWILGLLNLSTLIFAQEPLPANEAFAFSYQVTAPNKVLLSWQIAEGHYLYKQKFKFIPLNAVAQIVAPVFPVAETKQDKIFGNVEIYRHQLELELPISQANDKFNLDVVFQGCSDENLCYLPIHQTVSLP